MIVRCTSRYPTEDGLAALGPNFFGKQDFAVKKGAEYVVLGMFFANGSPHFGSGPWIEFKNQDGNMGVAPLVMFEIIDHRPSKYWEVHLLPNGELSIGPPSFNQEYYMEDYYDRVPEVFEDFHRISDLLEAEAAAD